MCLIPMAFIHNSNTCDVNLGPLSVTICSGKRNPYKANRLRNTSSVFSVVVVVYGIYLQPLRMCIYDHHVH